MNEGMQSYFDYTVSPLGDLFYLTLWNQLQNIKNKSILEFGSGFGFTANFLAENNKLTAIEYDETMLAMNEKKQDYSLIHGGLEVLQQMQSNSFDVVVCHLVLEFVENPKDFLQELIRVVKEDGIISIVRHNRAGRIIQSIVQDYDLAETKRLLQGEASLSNAFGDIKYYENEDVLNWAENTLFIEEIHAIRTLASLHNAQVQNSENWVDNMLEIELELQKNPDFIKISYFNHLILKKK